MTSRTADLLDALDPEQRQVAEALRGPVRVLAGAGTGKTRAITHRIAHGVATGVYQPTEVLAVTFTTRAAGEMRARLRAARRPGRPGAHLPLRRAAPAALLLAAGLRRRAADPDRVQAAAARARRTPPAARRRPGQLRDLASEVEWAKVSNVRPDDYAALAPARGRDGRRHGPRHRGPGVLRLRGRQARPGPDGHGGRAAPRPPRCSPRTSGSPPRSAASTSGSSSTSSRTSPRSSPPCSTSGWAAATRSASSATRPRRSTRFAGANAAYLRDFPRKHPGTTSVDLVRNYRSTPEVVAAANTLLSGTA